MLTASDRAMLKAALLAIRNDRPVTITIRRGTATLAAQVVRIAKTTKLPANTASTGTEAVTTGVTVLGDASLDIQPSDRFTVDGQLYQVVNVHPNRDYAVMAEVRLVQ
jgi:hypothetical protein